MSAIIILISQPRTERKLFKREGDLFVDLVTHKRVVSKKKAQEINKKILI